MVAQATSPPSQPKTILPDPYLLLKERPKKWNIRDDPITLSNWYKHINWLHTPLLIMIPVLGFYGLFTTPITMYTAIWAVIYYFVTGLGITAGKY
jgi:stearoyl-CoA desaturase (Delta-9 desaturase)